MRILYIDIDSLRPDHLGCYGYLRNTSPTLDRLADEGVRFTNCHTSDAPCLPSRTALFTGRFGIRTGVVNHGGVASQPFLQGHERGFRDAFEANAWPGRFRRLGYHTVAISPFGERHSAWHWYAGFNEVHNTGGGGNENADVITSEALDWLQRRGGRDNWFMHLNLWDPHTAYRVPMDYGNPFQGQPHPDWLTEEVRQAHWRGSGPHSAREAMGYSDEVPFYLKGRDLPRQPWAIDGPDKVRMMYDGYDTGVKYADDHIARVLNQLADLGVLDETAIVVSADHGENLGELNVYGDHQTADHCTCRIPMIVRWPGVTDGQAGRVDPGLHYHLDLAATTVELAGGTVPETWSGRSFANALREGRSAGRDGLVLSQGAWCVQRAARWGDLLYIRTWHDAWHDYPDDMLFNLADDPHELTNLAADHPELVREGRARIEAWREEQLADGPGGGTDPFDTVLAEGGSLHAREAGDYLQRLRDTGRGDVADRLAAKHGVVA